MKRKKKPTHSKEMLACTAMKKIIVLGVVVARSTSVSSREDVWSWAGCRRPFSFKSAVHTSCKNRRLLFIDPSGHLQLFTGFCFVFSARLDFNFLTWHSLDFLEYHFACLIHTSSSQLHRHINSNFCKSSGHYARLIIWLALISGWTPG